MRVWRVSWLIVLLTFSLALTLPPPGETPAPPPAELGQLGVVGGPAIHRRVVELEVAGVDDQAGGRGDAQAEAIRDGVADVEELAGERPAVDAVAGVDGVERDLGRGENDVMKRLRALRLPSDDEQSSG